MSERDILENFILWYDHRNVTGIKESLETYLSEVATDE